MCCNINYKGKKWDAYMDVNSFRIQKKSIFNLFGGTGADDYSLKRENIIKHFVGRINGLLTYNGVDFVVGFYGKGFVCRHRGDDVAAADVAIRGKWESHYKTSKNNQEWEHDNMQLSSKMGAQGEIRPEIQPSSIKKYAYLDLLLSDPDEKEEHLKNKGIKVDRLKAGINLLMKSKLQGEGEGYHCEVIYDPGKYYNDQRKTEFVIKGEVLIVSMVKGNVMQGLLLMNKDDLITLGDNVHPEPPAFGHRITLENIEGPYVFDLGEVVVVSKIPGDVIKDIQKVTARSGIVYPWTENIQLVKNYTALVGYYPMRNDSWFSTEMDLIATYPSQQIVEFFGRTDIYPKLQFFEG